MLGLVQYPGLGGSKVGLVQYPGLGGSNVRTCSIPRTRWL